MNDSYKEKIFALLALIAVVWIFALFSCSAVLNTDGIVYGEAPDVYFEELPGPSPYHRELVLRNTFPYPISADVECAYGLVSEIHVPARSTERRVVFTPTPRSWRGFFGVCDLFSWHRIPAAW